MDYTAGFFLFNEKNEVLIVHPTNAPLNTWSIPKGLVDEGETPYDAAKRELKEETNIDLDKCEIVFIRHGQKNARYKSGKKTLCAFFAKIRNSDALQLKCNSIVEGRNFYENDKIEWVTQNKALNLIHATQIEILIDFNPLSLD